MRKHSTRTDPPRRAGVHDARNVIGIRGGALPVARRPQRVWSQRGGLMPHGTPRDAILCQRERLTPIPRHPLKKTAPAVHGELVQAGHEVAGRAAGHDLPSLERAFPRSVEDRGKPSGWSRRADVMERTIPDPNLAQGLTFQRGRRHARSRFPSTALNASRGHFHRPSARLQQGDGGSRNFGERGRGPYAGPSPRSHSGYGKRPGGLRPGSRVPSLCDTPRRVVPLGSGHGPMFAKPFPRCTTSIHEGKQ